MDTQNFYLSKVTKYLYFVTWHLCVIYYFSWKVAIAQLVIFLGSNAILSSITFKSIFPRHCMKNARHVPQMLQEELMSLTLMSS